MFHGITTSGPNWQFKNIPKQSHVLLNHWWMGGVEGKQIEFGEGWGGRGFAKMVQKRFCNKCKIELIVSQMWSFFTILCFLQHYQGHFIIDQFTEISIFNSIFQFNIIWKSLSEETLKISWYYQIFIGAGWPCLWVLAFCTATECWMHLYALCQNLTFKEQIWQ